MSKTEELLNKFFYIQTGTFMQGRKIKLVSAWENHQDRITTLT